MLGYLQAILYQNDDGLQIRLIKENFNRTGIKKSGKNSNINKVQAFHRGQMIVFDISFVIAALQTA